MVNILRGNSFFECHKRFKEGQNGVQNDARSGQKKKKKNFKEVCKCCLRKGIKQNLKKSHSVFMVDILG